MEFRVELAPRALLQIEAIHDWIVERSPDRADEWQAGLFRAIDSLRSFPRRCPRASRRARMGYTGEIRELMYGKRPSAYRVIFGIKGDVISVLRVVHAARGRIDG